MKPTPIPRRNVPLPLSPLHLQTHVHTHTIVCHRYRQWNNGNRNNSHSKARKQQQQHRKANVRCVQITWPFSCLKHGMAQTHRHTHTLNCTIVSCYRFDFTETLTHSHRIMHIAPCHIFERIAACCTFYTLLCSSHWFKWNCVQLILCDWDCSRGIRATD